MPEGALIVKENYAPDGTVEASGKVDGCIGCHASGTDYVRTQFGS